MVKKWEEVAASDAFKSLPLVERERARDQYFNEVVGSQLNEVDLPTAREQFLAHTKDLQTTSEKASTNLREFGKNLLSDASRVVGVGLGVVNSPLAFVWGSQQARETDKEQYDKMPKWKQALVSTGAGFDSAWRSISEKGDFGTLYGDYYKSVTGKTIEESLPEGTKWAAPTIEFLVNTVTDPLFVGSSIGKLATLKVPKDFIGQLPKELVDDFQRLNELDVVDKRNLQKSVLDILKNRKEYINWWEKASDGIEEVRLAKEQFRANVPTAKALPAGQGFILRDRPVLSEFSPKLAQDVKQASQLALPKAQGFDLVGAPYRKEAEELASSTIRFNELFKQESLTVEQLQEVGQLKTQFRTLLKNQVPEKLAIIAEKPSELQMLKQKLTNPPT